MAQEVYRGDLSDIAKIYTTLGLSKVSRTNKDFDSRMNLYINKKVVREEIQARIGIQLDDYSYVVVVNDRRLEVDYLAFLINSMPWKVMLGDGNKFLEGLNISTSLGALKKLPIVIISSEEQSACSLLNKIITTIHDAWDNNEDKTDNMKVAYRYLSGIRDYISLEILLDGVLRNSDISVLSAWMEKKSIFDATDDKNEAMKALIKTVFSSNDELRDRINKMKLYIDENADVVFNQFPK